MKKAASLLIAFVLMLTFSTGAFAAKGIADTKESALDLVVNRDMSLYILDSSDKDWYKWENNTGKMQSFFSYLRPLDDFEGFRYGFTIKYKDNTTTSMFYADPKPGPAHVVDRLYLPPGATIYFQVEKLNNKSSQYNIYFLNFD